MSNIWKIPFALAAGWVGMKTYIVSEMKHFSISEFGASFIYLTNALLVKLDMFREKLGSRVDVSQADGATIRFRDESSTGDSQHFYGRAIDVILSPGVDIRKAVQVAREVGFTGIGVYPKSAGINGRWRLHLDVRPGDHVATWGAVPLPLGGREMVSLETALNLFA